MIGKYSAIQLVYLVGDSIQALFVSWCIQMPEARCQPRLIVHELLEGVVLQKGLHDKGVPLGACHDQRSSPEAILQLDLVNGVKVQESLDDVGVPFRARCQQWKSGVAFIFVETYALARVNEKERISNQHPLHGVYISIVAGLIEDRL
jgi:hypothetical protein